MRYCLKRQITEKETCECKGWVLAFAASQYGFSLQSLSDLNEHRV